MTTYNLRQVQRVITNSIEGQILQLVDGDEEILAEGSHGGGCCTDERDNRGRRRDAIVLVDRSLGAITASKVRSASP